MNIKLSFGPWLFSPGLASTLVTVLLFPLFVYLGFWQLGRMAEKIQLQTELENRITSPPLKIEDIKSENNIRFHRLQVKGEFLNTDQILLDNQIFQGQAGYHIITPLYPENSEDIAKILLIDRGWVPIEEDRSNIPSIKPIQGTVTITGIINQPPQPLVLEETPLAKHPIFPLLLQTIDFKKLETVLDHSIFPFLVQLQAESPYAYTTPPITFGVPANRHLGYAVQWFTMAIISLLYYFGINTRRHS